MPARIFVNYRRDDDPNGAARVSDGLTAKFGRSSVFMDVDNLLAGQRFDEELAKALTQCDVLVAVIGPRWMEALAARRETGERDYVREEIAEALRRRIVVIPVLVGRDRQMPPLPRPDDLPEDIRDLVLYQKHDVAYERFGRDIAELIEAITVVRRTNRPQFAGAGVRWGWLGAAAAGVMAIGYAGAYFLGVPLPWSATVSDPPGLTVAKAQAEREAKLIADAETRIRGEIEAWQRAEAEARRTADEAAAAKRKADDDARAKAAAEAKRKADEDAARRDPALAVKPGSGQSFRDCAACPEMVVVPTGEFMMGSTPAEIDAVSKERSDLADFVKWESPRRKVSIAQPFAVGRTHITRGEFAAFLTATGHKIDGGCGFDGKATKIDATRTWRSPGFDQTDAHPVVCVNWQDAQAYAAWLSQRSGKSYRLMSEAEAEYVTRATTQATSQPRFFFGNDYKDLCTHGNGADRAAAGKFNWDLKTVAPCDDGYVYTAPVASFRANAWGLHDVHGNAWSWTADCFVDSYTGAQSDGSARTSGSCASRVLRGGSWYYDPQDLRGARRNRSQPDLRFNFLGFRLARTLTNTP